MLNRSASLAMSTYILKALPGKLDKKRHSPSIRDKFTHVLVSLPIRLLSPLVCYPWSSHFSRFWYWCIYSLCVVILVRPDAYFFQSLHLHSSYVCLGSEVSRDGTDAQAHLESSLLPCEKQQNLKNRHNHAISCSYLNHFYPLYWHFFLLWNCCPHLTSAAHIQVHFRLDFFMEANNMKPDQPAPLGAVWSGYMLFTILATSEHKQMREQMTVHDWRAKG